VLSLLRAVAQKIGPRQNVLRSQVSKELNKLRGGIVYGFGYAGFGYQG
jgi:hypothetical protein